MRDWGAEKLTICPKSQGWLVLGLREFISYDSKIGRKMDLISSLFLWFTWTSWSLFFVSRDTCAECILQSQTQPDSARAKAQLKEVTPYCKWVLSEDLTSMEIHHSPAASWPTRTPGPHWLPGDHTWRREQLHCVCIYLRLKEGEWLYLLYALVSSFSPSAA